MAKLTAGWADTLTPEFAARAGVSLAALRAGVDRRVRAELMERHANAHDLNGATV